MWWVLAHVLRYCCCSRSTTSARSDEHVTIAHDMDKAAAVTLLSATSSLTPSPSLASVAAYTLPRHSSRVYCVYFVVTAVLLLVIAFLWVVQRIERLRQRRALLRHMMSAGTAAGSRAAATTAAHAAAASTSTWLSLYGLTCVRTVAAAATTSTAMVAGGKATSSCALRTYACSVRARCIICFAATAVRPLALLPCGHCQMCTRCVAALWRHGGTQQCLRCPLCRQPVDCVCPATLIDRHDSTRVADDNNDDSCCCSSNSLSSNDTSGSVVVADVASAKSHQRSHSSSNDDDEEDDDEEDKVKMSAAEEVLFVHEYNKRFRRRGRLRWLSSSGNNNTWHAQARPHTDAVASSSSLLHDGDVCWHERCVRVLRCITNARYLPTIVAVRISLLHLTMIAFLLMPQDILPVFYLPSGSSSSSSSDGSGSSSVTTTTTMMASRTSEAGTKAAALDVASTMTVLVVPSAVTTTTTTLADSTAVDEHARTTDVAATTATLFVHGTRADNVVYNSNNVNNIDTDDDSRNSGGDADTMAKAAAAADMRDAGASHGVCSRQRLLRVLGVVVETVMRSTDDVFLFVFGIVLLGHVLLRSLFDDAYVD